MSLAKFIPIILPHEPIGGGIGGPSVPLLGHGAFIIVDSTGKASFYEYGHFDPDPNIEPYVITHNSSGNDTNVRGIGIDGTMQYDSSGNITASSLQNALDQVFGNPNLYPNDPGEVFAAPFDITDIQYSSINSALGNFLSGVDSGNNDYELFGINCMRFVYDMADAGGLTISYTQDIEGIFDLGEHITIPSVAGDAILAYAGGGYQYFSPFSWVNETTPTSFINYINNFNNELSHFDFGAQFLKGTGESSWWAVNYIGAQVTHLSNVIYNLGLSVVEYITEVASIIGKTVGEAVGLLQDLVGVAISAVQETSAGISTSYHQFLNAVARSLSVDPLIIDMAGDGLSLDSWQTSNALFDLNGDGAKENTGWTRLNDDDAFLVIDKNSNGNIDDISEMFGNAAVVGFTELKKYDSNSDNLINSSDSQFNLLSLWNDANANGTVAGEMTTLSANDNDIYQDRMVA